MDECFETYLQELQQNIASGIVTEHSHRAALQKLLATVGNRELGGAVAAINEPRRIACGAPDYILTQAHTLIGYVEAKDIGAPLDAIAKSAQLQRYRAALHNLILTDYLEFRWYVGGEPRAAARLASVVDDKIFAVANGARAVAKLLSQFFAQKVTTVAEPQELARRMATLAHIIRNLIEETFTQEGERGKLHAQLDAFRSKLIPDLTPAQFADMYAQTIAYGLFAARVRAVTRKGEGFSRQDAAWNLPATNLFLRKLFNEIAGPDLDDRVAWAVDDLARLLDYADMAEVLRDFARRTREEDPVVHFYETFLRSYDPQMRQTRGVYYTPEPVVSYIVRAIDHILRTRFSCPLGLADPDTLILDPAVGTATFLYFVVRQIHENLQTAGQSGWNDYVKTALLPRVFGFELLMAPYTVAHMKLGVLLQELGYDFAGDQRLGIYLTNALDKGVIQTATLGFSGFITEEANAAAEIKADKPIVVVLGNPPYAVSSANRGEYIDSLMERYKTAVRGERNIQPLSDDYIKFMRFAHDRIERTGYGVMGLITNHSYLTGLIHRGMREELLKTFDEIYILNLHGNALIGETAPDGGANENVFDIRQGVAIALFVKERDGAPASRVYYADLWGARQEKYAYLLAHDLTNTTWQELTPTAPHFFFVPKDFDLAAEYERGWSVADIFPVHVSGIKTHRDDLVIDFDEEKLRARISMLRDARYSDDELRHRFGLRDNGMWNLAAARQALRADDDWEKAFARCLYRPFDVRHIFYHEALIDRPRNEVMQHMTAGNNVALIACRQFASHKYFTISCTDKLTEISSQPFAPYVVFPLYIYTTPENSAGTIFANGEITREPNLSPKFLAAIKAKLGLCFVPDSAGDLQHTFGPEDIFHYAYAVFHSPVYRERYAESLKIDFPRLPLISDCELFAELVRKGAELVTLHLLDSSALSRLITTYPVEGTNEVKRIRYAAPRRDENGAEIAGRVYINETQYFAGVAPNLWEFYVGGYQVLHKWLKDRKGRELSFEERMHYQQIVVALRETTRIMTEIEETLDFGKIIR